MEEFRVNVDVPIIRTLDAKHFRIQKGRAHRFQGADEESHKGVAPSADAFKVHGQSSAFFVCDIQKFNGRLAPAGSAISGCRNEVVRSHQTSKQGRQASSGDQFKIHEIYT